MQTWAAAAALVEGACLVRAVLRGGRLPVQAGAELGRRGPAGALALVRLPRVRQAPRHQRLHSKCNHVRLNITAIRRLYCFDVKVHPARANSRPVLLAPRRLAGWDSSSFAAGNLQRARSERAQE